MTIDTGQRTIRIQVQKQLFAIATGLLFSIAYFSAPREFLDTYCYSHYLVSILILLAYIVYQLYFWIRDISYVYASDESLMGMLRIRHFRILPLCNAKHAIELPLTEFYRYVSIWQRQGSELYRYPRFSITLLRKTERAQLFALLDRYLPS